MTRIENCSLNCDISQDEISTSNDTHDIVPLQNGQPTHEGGNGAIRNSAHSYPVVVRTNRFHLTPGQVVLLGNFVAAMAGEVENDRVVLLYLWIVDEVLLESG